jgi:hypothetical protein
LPFLEGASNGVNVFVSRDRFRDAEQRGGLGQLVAGEPVRVPGGEQPLTSDRVSSGLGRVERVSVVVVNGAQALDQAVG